MAEAICIKCGEPKRIPWERCLRCRFDPEGDSDALVRSVYFSTGRFDDEELADAYRSVLDDDSRVIRSGGPVDVDQTEYARLDGQRVAVAAVGWRNIARLLWIVFRPAILLLGAFFLMKLVARLLSGH